MGLQDLANVALYGATLRLWKRPGVPMAAIRHDPTAELESDVKSGG